MVIVCFRKVLVVCVIVGYANKVSSTSKTKFSFAKTFKTPDESYKEAVAKLDDCEILERANFSSDEEVEDKVKKAQSPKAKRVEGPVAKAQIHLRFGIDPEPPVQRNDHFIELPQFNTRSCHHCHLDRVPHYYHYGPYGHYHFPPLNYHRYYYNSGFECPGLVTPCPRCQGRRENTKGCCGEREVPYVHFYSGDICGNKPDEDEIQRQPIDVLTGHHLDLIDEYFGEGRHPDCPGCKKSKPTEKPQPVREVVLAKVVNAAPCQDKPRRDCLDLTDNLKFVKVELNEITDGWRGRSEDQFELRCQGRLNIDMDELLKIQGPVRDDDDECVFAG